MKVVQTLDHARELAAACGGRVESGAEIRVYEPGDELPVHMLSDEERGDGVRDVVSDAAVDEPHELSRWQRVKAFLGLA